MSGDDWTYVRLPGGETVTRGATAPILFDGLRQRLDKAQQDLAVQLADIQAIAALLADLADPDRTVEQLPGPRVY